MQKIELRQLPVLAIVEQLVDDPPASPPVFFMLLDFHLFSSLLLTTRSLFLLDFHLFSPLLLTICFLLLDFHLFTFALDNLFFDKDFVFI